MAAESAGGLVSGEIGKEEFAERPIGDGGGECVFGGLAGGELIWGEIHEGLDFTEPSVRVGFGSDIHNDETGEPIGEIMGNAHGDFAAEAVAHENGVFDVVGIHPANDIGGHFRVGHGGGPGGFAMVAEVERMNGEMLAEGLGHGLPVAGGTEKPVENEESGFANAREAARI